MEQLYLVQYVNPDGSFFQSIHNYAEVISTLKKMEEVGGAIRIYRLRKNKDPERMWAYKVGDDFCLGDIYKNLIWE